MKKFKVLVSTILIVVFLFSSGVGTFAAGYGPYLETMLQFMTGMYYKGLTDEEGLKSTLKGMFSGLDNYTVFLDDEETEVLNESLTGSFSGVGISLEKVENAIKINKVYEHSPAEKAGLQDGDLITAIDGKSVDNMTVDTAAASIRGEEGTTVVLTIKRGQSIKEIPVVRGKVTITALQYRTEGKIGYIKIDSFNQGVSREFREVINEINTKGIKKIILDLRGNPGGYVEEAVEVAKKLIPPGPVTTLNYKSEEFMDQTYYSYANNPKYLIAVLVDENTASASEILAGALVDTGTGFLVGQKTYGKGVFQTIFSILTPEAYEKYSKLYGAQYVTDLQWMSYYGVTPKKNEILGTVKITTGYYLTPKGRAIEGVGLDPSVKEPNPTKPNGVDTSLLVPLMNTEPLTLNLYDNAVYDAERILKAAGYFTGTADKNYDKETAEAVKKYQAEQKIPVTGAIDVKTRDRLNQTFLELRKENDKQYSRAVEILNWFKD